MVKSVSKAASFEIPCTRCIAADGSLAEDLPPGAEDVAEDRDRLIALYRGMALTRQFDAKAVSLQRTGRLGTFASSLGQEAIGVGVAAAMMPEDVLLPSYREASAQLWRGAPLQALLAYWGGDERGSAAPEFGRDFPIAIPVASQCLHAAGVAYALKHRKEPAAAVCFVGDGGTSKGDFYEALNCAGAWKAPLLMVVSNNAWAISVPKARQTAARTYAQKALAAGIPGEQVDGNDLVAVTSVAERLLAAARAGAGPQLMEAVTYRLSDHTTADDAGRYRDSEEVGAHWKAEPLLRLRGYLTARGWWSKEDEVALLEEVAAEIEAGVVAYLAQPPAAATEMFDSLYATLPADLEAQRRALAGEADDA